jgi:hypothetical protein
LVTDRAAYAGDVQLEDQLPLCQHRRDPAVPVVVRRPLDDEVWPGLLHGWADAPEGRTGGLRGLVTYDRVVGPGYTQSVVAWVQVQHISQQ